jgi:hypothetical protein
METEEVSSGRERDGGVRALKGGEMWQGTDHATGLPASTPSKGVAVEALMALRRAAQHAVEVSGAQAKLRSQALPQGARAPQRPSARSPTMYHVPCPRRHAADTCRATRPDMHRSCHDLT